MHSRRKWIESVNKRKQYKSGWEWTRRTRWRTEKESKRRHIQWPAIHNPPFPSTWWLFNYFGIHRQWVLVGIVAMLVHDTSINHFLLVGHTTSLVLGCISTLYSLSP